MRLGSGQNRKDVVGVYLWNRFFVYWAVFEVAVLELTSAKTHRPNKIMMEYKASKAIACLNGEARIEEWQQVKWLFGFDYKLNGSYFEEKGVCV